MDIEGIKDDKSDFTGVRGYGQQNRHCLRQETGCYRG